MYREVLAPGVLGKFPFSFLLHPPPIPPRRVPPSCFLKCGFFMIISQVGEDYFEHQVFMVKKQQRVPELLYQFLLYKNNVSIE